MGPLSNYAGIVDNSWLLSARTAFEQCNRTVIPELQRKQKQNNLFYPAEHLIFRALKETPFQSVKYVILGDHPYPDNTATGLAFDTPKDKLSPSLRNFRANCLKHLGEFKGDANSTSYLEHLPSQGVLLLNTVLTAPSKLSYGKDWRTELEAHRRLWLPITRTLILSLRSHLQITWLLMGQRNQQYKPLINAAHTIVETAHPSPFSVHNFDLGEFITVSKIKL